MNSDNEDPEEIRSWKGVSGTIILINVYDPINLGTTAKSYTAVSELLRSYMRTNNSQQLGVCLYGVNDANPSTSQGIEGVFQIFPLTLPTLDELKTLQSTNITSIGQAKELKLSDALWHCNKMFSNCKNLLSTKTIIMLTRLDIPPINADQTPTFKRVNDLVNSGIQIKIVNVSEHIHPVDIFYENFLTEAHKSNEFKLPEPVWDEIEIIKLMYQHSHRHTAIARLSLEIGEGFSIGVGVYGLRQSQTKPKKVIAHKETNQIVTSVNTKSKVSYNNEDFNNDDAMDVDEAEIVPKEVPLLKSELLYYQVFGEERVEFTVDEMSKLKNPFGPPMMKLLGFKPNTLLCKEKWFLKGCHFLYPSESTIEGSTIAFKALHQACTQMSVIAICVICTRVNSKPFIVALSPCTKPLGLDLKIGFHIIHMPFVENIRNVPNEESDRKIDTAHKMVLRDIIRDLNFDFHSDMFESPSLQSLYNAIEALALDREEVESIRDTTKPDRSKFENIDAELFEEIFGPFGSTAVKRPGTGNTNNAGGKREKVENIDEVLLETRLSRREVHKYNVGDLKTILRAKNYPKSTTNLKKNDLVQLVYNHLLQLVQ